MPPRLRRIALARSIAAALVAFPACWLFAANPQWTPPMWLGFEKPATTRFENDPDRLVFITAHWRNKAELRAIASKFQHLMIDDKARTARTEASAADLRTLRRMGVRYEIDDTATTKMRTAEAALAERTQLSQHGLRAEALRAEEAIPGFSCYRTVEETYATMDQLAAEKPNIASVVDIGPTWQWQNSGGAAGYRMRVLRVNNPATDGTAGPKADMVVLAAIHAREYTTAELVTRFSEWLIDGYGTDAEATWLVDNFRFHFLLQANPDGRKEAESGLSWRKNVDTGNGTCDADAYGVDLNRNWPWQFRTVAGGSSGAPCDSTYRGPSAMSEPETQNAMRYVVGTQGTDGVFRGGVFPDSRTDTGTAPSTYRGLFLDIHSFSRFVLWPWAYTDVAAPNGTALQTFGRRLAFFNNYKPQQWIGMYPADGTNTDSVYGATGAPSYTVELGSAFFESCSTFEASTFPQNFEMLRYAARNLNAPYRTPGGPDATSIGGSATRVIAGQPWAVSAWFNDARYNQTNGTEAVQNIASARVYIDQSPWTPGATPIAMQASDGAFNSSQEQAVATINTANLARREHYAVVQGVDASGVAGTPRVIRFTVTYPNKRVETPGLPAEPQAAR